MSKLTRARRHIGRPHVPVLGEKEVGTVVGIVFTGRNIDLEGEFEGIKFVDWRLNNKPGFLVKLFFPFGEITHAVNNIPSRI